MFNLAQAFSFKHLPDPGGLYQQHPDILDRFLYIKIKQQEADEKRRIEEERKNKRKGPKMRRT